MGRRREPPNHRRYPVSIELDDGRTISGTYYEAGRPPWVYVSSVYGSKSAAAGASGAEFIAQILLRELFQEYSQREGSP